MAVWSLLVAEVLASELLRRRVVLTEKTLLLSQVAIGSLAGSCWSTDLFSELEQFHWDVDALCLQLLLGILKFILRNLEMVSGSEQVLEVQLGIRFNLVQNLVWLLLLVDGVAHQLVDSDVRLFNLLP